MKILCIAENRNLRHAIEQILGSNENSLVFAEDPLAETERLRSCSPDIILMNFEDYPLHWKPFLIMADRILEGGYRFILLTGRTFLIEESTAAEYLGAELIPWNTEVRFFRGELRKAVTGTYPVRKKQGSLPKADFAFMLPGSCEMIFAERVWQLSDRDIVFTLEKEKSRQLSETGEIHNCILRLGNELIRPACRVESIGKNIRMLFTSITDSEKEKINNSFTYI